MSPVAVGQPRTCSHQTRSHDPLTFTPLTPQTDYYKYSFLPLTIVDWNSLPFSLRAKPSVDSFRASIISMLMIHRSSPGWRYHLPVPSTAYRAMSSHSSTGFGTVDCCLIPTSLLLHTSAHQDVCSVLHSRLQ